MVHVIAHGVVYCSVCVPKDMSRLDIEQGTNLEIPTGISSRWKISNDKEFRTGQPNPCQCEQFPNSRLHYLLNC